MEFMVAVAQVVSHEADVSEALSAVMLPKGVRLLRFSLDSDWSGDPAVHIVYGVSKKIPLTKARVRELVALSRAAADAVDQVQLDRHTYVTFDDVR
ncbi:MAG: hypothetical protein M3R43_06635 [Acidobacteriota bacterium]|nr:hypothetical protein [Acidobacteriota bacterium]